MNNLQKLNESFYELKKLYFLFESHDGINLITGSLEQVNRLYRDIYYPNIYLDEYDGIEVEVHISTINHDVKQEFDDYSHALRQCVVGLSSYRDKDLSLSFNDSLFSYLLNQEFLLDEINKYFVYPYETYVKGKGLIRQFISTNNYVKNSLFSYQHILSTLHAYRLKKDDVYLSLDDVVLVDEKTFRDIANSIHEQYSKAEEIYHKFYQEYLVPLYEEAFILLKEYDSISKKLELSFNGLDEDVDKLNYKVKNMMDKFNKIIDNNFINDYFIKHFKL